MPAACSGLRVLELSQGLTGPLATMVLSDFGADVVRVEPPAGDPWWDEPAYLMLNRGKQSIDLDIRSAEGRAEIHRLIPGFDVVVETLGTGVADAAGIGYDDLAAINPGLVYCSITGFGTVGPLAGVKADEGLVMAKGGIFRDQPGWFREGGRPVFRSNRDHSYITAMLATQGILSALRARDITGKGTRVETSLLDSLTCRLNPFVPLIRRAGEEIPPGGGYAGVQDPRARRESQASGLTLPCKDDRWIVHVLFDRNWFPSWISAIGFDWIWDDERFKGAPSVYPDDAARLELIARIRERMKEKTADEWMDIYVSAGSFCVSIIQTTQEAIRHPQVVAAGYLIEVDDPRVGRITELAPIVQIPDSPGVVRGPAPIPGQDTAAVLTAPVVARAVAPTGRTLARPLEGITIIEAATFYATTAGNAMLADLGARVIKVEPFTGDPYRRAVGQQGIGNLARSVQGKENIAIDLKDPRGREILYRLVANADGFAHNFRIGVPERLGIDYETLKKVNPRLVYQYAASYGSTGPYRGMPAIDHVIAAFSGTGAHQAGEGNEPLNEQGADPIAAATSAVSMLLGLATRDHTGKGLAIESSMILSNLYMNCEDALIYDGKPPRRPVDHLQLGTGPTYRLYETAPEGPGFHAEPYENADPRWVFLAAEHDDEFAQFCRAVGRTDLAADARFATRGARDRNGAELSEVLASIFRTRSASEWETSMLAAGVGCVVADAMSNFAFLYTDPQAVAMELMTLTEHPRFGGGYWRPSPVIRVAGMPLLAGPFCEAGEDSREILAEFGYGADEIQALKDDGVVNWPDPA